MFKLFLECFLFMVVMAESSRTVHLNGTLKLILEGSRQGVVNHNHIGVFQVVTKNVQEHFLTSLIQGTREHFIQEQNVGGYGRL